MSEIQRIRLDEKFQKTMFSTYERQTKEELLTVFGGSQEFATGVEQPKDQKQSEGEVRFNTNELTTAKKQLAEQGHETDDIGFTHNHNRDSNHGFAFSQADLDTAQKLYDEQGVDRMGLVMNGKTLSDGKVGVQHMVIANHKGDLHDLEGDEGQGKVLTTFEDEHHQKHEIYSESIEEAEEKERQIIALKEQLFAQAA